MMNLKVGKYPIDITLHDGNIIKSTHTCNLDLPWLLHGITKVYVVLRLTHEYQYNNFSEGWKVIHVKEECWSYKSMGDNYYIMDITAIPINATHLITQHGPD